MSKRLPAPEYQPVTRVFQPYDPLEDEPNLDLVFRSRRKLDKNGKPCSEWEYGYAVEGVWRAPLSQLNRDYAAALLHHSADLLAEPIQHDAPLEQRIAWAAKMLRARQKAAMDEYVRLAAALVEKIGLHAAASQLGEKEIRLAHLMKSRDVAPAQLRPPTPEGKQSQVLKLLAAEVIREKVAVG
jgi:hypothetical protein